MNSQQFRRHPGGFKSLIKTVTTVMIFFMTSHAILLVTGFVLMLTQNVYIEVTSFKIVRPDIVDSDFIVKHIKYTGILNFKVRNIMEWLLLPRDLFADIYTNGFAFLITLYCFRILKKIDIERPFYEKISKMISKLYQVLFIGTAFFACRGLYIYFLLRNFGDGNYRAIPNFISYGYLLIVTWMIVYVIGYIYKKGVILQQEHDLVI